MALLNKMSGRQKLEVAVAILLVVLVVVFRGNVPTDELPTAENIDSRVEECRKLQEDIAELRQRRQIYEDELAELRRQARPFWPAGNRAPGVQVQSELEQLARQARVTIQTISGLRESKLTENVRSVELTIRMNAPMREVSMLLKELRKARHPLHWASCSIRPDNPREPKGVVLTGKIRAFVLTAEATEFIFGRQSSA